MEVEQVEIREHLRQHPPFSLISPENLDDVAMNVEVGYFKAGKKVLSLGDTIKDLHFIRSGAVEIYRRSGEIYNRLSQGQIFGQLALMTGRSARFPVRALEDTLIYFIPGEVFARLFEEEEAFADFVEVEDRTRLRQSRARQSSSNDLLTTPVGRLVSRPPVTITESASVIEAARQMTEEGVSSIIVMPDSDDQTKDNSRPDRLTMRGIVTDSDFRRRVIANNLPLETPVRDVMSTGMVHVRDDQRVFEAMLTMLRENVHHLPVIKQFRPVGVVDLSDIVSHESKSSLFVVQNIHGAQSVDELSALLPDVYACFVRLVNEDANSHMVGAAMATIGRSFKQRLLELGEIELGPPPVPYCFLALGSMARDEQLLFTDQDNAMVLDDSFDTTRHDEYFLKLARFVCDGLARCGYEYCKGDIMATNRQWRQPLATWKGKFEQWICNPRPEALLHSSIFFDLTGVHGNKHLADELNTLIAARASQAPGFLGCLARNAQNRTPPLGFFKDFVLEKSGRHQNSINLKRRGTAPLVDVIRVHALASGSREQNSFSRLDDIVAGGFLTPSMVSDLRDALEFISMVRIRHQAMDVEAGREPNNNIDPEDLTTFDRRNLKDAFRVLSDAQRFLKLRYRPQQTG